MHSFHRFSVLLLSLIICIQAFSTSFNDVTIGNIIYSYSDGHAIADGKNATGDVILKNEIKFEKQEWINGQYETISETVPVTEIRSFSNNANITSITANNINSIPNGAFRRCTSLKKVALGNTVKTIGDQAFSECTALKEVNLPDGLTSIGSDCFKGCKSLFATSTLIIPGTVTSVGNSAFIESGVNEVSWKTECAIPDNAFNKCKRLKSITANYTSGIGKWALANCDSLKSILIPRSCTTIGSQAFRNDTSLTTVTLNKNITYIADFAFSNTGIVKLEFPEGFEKLTIGPKAFELSYKLETITFFDSKEIIIQDDAFRGTPKLKKINFGEGVTEIGCGNFWQCPLLQNFKLPETIRKIDANSFNYCDSITQVDLPKNIDGHTILLRNSFCSCKNLTIVTKDPDQQYDYDGSFQYGKKTVEVINRKTSKNNNVSSRTTRANAKSIVRNFAFYGCENLEVFEGDFIVGAGVGAAFGGCRKLQFDSYHISFNDTVPSYAAPGCFVKHITMPMSVRVIKDKAIANAGTVSIPDSLRIIHTNAIQISEMEEIELPDSLHSVYDYCIRDNGELRKLIIKAKTPPVYRKDDGSPYTAEEIENTVSFFRPPQIVDGCDYIVLYVPKGTTEAYKNAPGWNKFKDIIEYGENSSVDDISIAKPTVTVEDGRIVVSDSVPVMIFNPSGVMLYNGNSDNIPAFPKGLYIVKAAATTVKISL